jgi:hypothetical protein
MAMPVIAYPQNPAAVKQKLIITSKNTLDHSEAFAILPGIYSQTITTEADTP